MNGIIVTLLILFAIRSIRAILYQQFYWQKKEYRLDTMWVHLKSPLGQRWMFGKIALLKWILLLAYIFWYYQKFVLPGGPTGEYIPLLAAYALEIVLIGNEIRSGLKLPKFTPKILLITLLTIGASVWVLTRPLPWPLKILLADKLLPFVLAIQIILFGLLAFVRRKIIILEATRKLTQYPKLIRIGITGSYGKSSTKEFLSTILAQKYRVVKTEKNFNTDIGIARAILKQITPDTQVLIAEMGAYKRGEIKQSCQMVKPMIGIVTGLNEQHIELFGSLANTRTAKYELIASLPQRGLAVINGENEYTRLMAKKTKHTQVLLYGLSSRWSIWADRIESDSDGLRFQLHFADKTISCKTKLLGKHMVSNILAASAVAWKLGLSVDQIKTGISQLSALDGKMQKAGHYRGATLIDDTYNVNPDSVKAAISYMHEYPGKKYLVVTPMIELGSKASAIHESVGALAAQSEVAVWSTNKAYHDELARGAKRYQGEYSVLQGREIVSKLQKELKDGDVVVFEGKEAARPLSLLLKKQL
jgi:UDP-N-acetylmuramoyl-tripeptide--D-alanyl-D-alanine ligase